MYVKCAAVDVERSVGLNAVAVNIYVKGTAVDGDRACGIGINSCSLGLVRCVGSALNAVVSGFYNEGSLTDDDAAVAADAVVYRRAGGGRAVVFCAAADIDRSALVEDQ